MSTFTEIFTLLPLLCWNVTGNRCQQVAYNPLLTVKNLAVRVGVVSSMQ